MSAQPLPRLLNRKQLAEELNVNLSTAERFMRKVPKFYIGRSVYVLADDVAAHIAKEVRQ